MEKERIFIRPAMPLPDMAALWLADELATLSDGKIFDFEGVCVVVPTRQAGRTLAQKLSSAFLQKFSTGFAGLKILTAEDLLGGLLAGTKAASRFETCRAWQAALEDAPRGAIEALFPGGVRNADSYAFSKRLMKLRAGLSERGLDFSFAARKFAHMEDGARWEALALLEKSYARRLEGLGKEDAAGALLKAARGAGSADGVRRVYLAFLPEPAPLLARVVESAARLPVKIMIAADADDAEFFDEWGRPQDAWRERRPLLEDSDIRSFADRAQQAQSVARALSGCGLDAGLLFAVSCEDSESEYLISQALQKEGVPSYAPRGVPLSEGELFALAEALWNFLSGGGFADFSRLLRCGAFLRGLSADLALLPDEILKRSDAFAKRRLCASLKSALRLKPLSDSDAGALEIFRKAADLLEPLEGADGPLAARALEEFFLRLFPAAASGADAELFEAARAALLDAFEDAENSECLPAFGCAEILRAALDHYDSPVYFPPEDAERTLCLQNWLELFWSPSPRVLACDMNEGVVPERFEPDGFLTDSLRAQLGMPSSKSRHARDAYMLWALKASRSAEGMGARFFAARRSVKGDSLNPSALLLACPAPELPRRVEKLFAPPPPKEGAPPFFAPWKLKIPCAELPSSLSATNFKDYIACPFRFYLRHILKMEAFKPDFREMDAAQTGTLFHRVFEDFAARAENAALADAEKIEAFLLDSLQKNARALFGDVQSPQLRFQLRGLRRRLGACARVQAEHAAQGWRIKARELRLDTMEIGGFKIVCRIDRLDEHEDGRLMIVDYKTFDSPSKTLSESPVRASHFTFKKRAGEFVWHDLQMPLYAQSLFKSDFAPGVAGLCCAYFLAPKNVTATKIDPWEISEEELESALAKAAEICAAVRARNFEPAEKPPLYDDYAELFGFDPALLVRHLEFEKK